MTKIRIEHHRGTAINDDISTINEVIQTWDADEVYYDAYGGLNFGTDSGIVKLKQPQKPNWDWYKITIIE